MKTDKTSIYIDLQRLLKALHHASFDIPAKDRIVYLDDAIREAKQVLASFAMAYNFPEERMYYIRAMVAQFEVLKVSLREMAEEHIFRGKRSDKTGYLLVEMEVFECLGKIEEGIGKWRNSLIRGAEPHPQQDAVVKPSIEGTHTLI